MRAVPSLLGLLAMMWMSAAVVGAAAPDPYMGDWKGSVTGAGGGTRDLYAQVIALGKGTYRAVFLGTLERRVDPVAMLDGVLSGETVQFGDVGGIAGDIFEGTLVGDGGGAFQLKRFLRSSPTLGAAPPAGAVVLYDGSGLDEWRNPQRIPGIADLNKSLKKATQCAGYLRNAIWVPGATRGRFEVGSDDGVKIWLNGKVVHANNIPRGCAPGQDVFDVDLQQGWNPLLVKIVQGMGGWAAHVRVTDADGNPLPGAKVKIAPRTRAGAEMPALDASVNATVLAWEGFGPYRVEGKTGTQLFDVPLGPELTEGRPGVGKCIDGGVPDSGTRWKMLEGNILEVGRKGGSFVTKREFGSHRLHIEFRTPFMPTKRGQARGNSGVYVQGRYEVQVLDSYGLKGKDNECGGIYKVAMPRVNMCFPPMHWQTYDIDFTAPTFDGQGKKTADARITVRHNGVVIHDNVALPGPTGGGRRGDLSTPGPLLLQDHGNPVQYRNIWVVER